MERSKIRALFAVALGLATTCACAQSSSAPASHPASQAAAQKRYFGAYRGEIAGLHDPVAAAIDRDGVIYIADAGSHRIRAFQATGAAVRDFGGYGTAEGQLIWPAAIALGPDERLYVADSGNRRVQVFERDGRFVRAITTPEDAPVRMRQPSGVFVDVQGTAFVADSGSRAVLAFKAPPGSPPNVIGGESTGRDRPTDVAADNDGNVYAVDAEAHRVRIYGSQPRPPWGEWGNAAGFFNRPTGITFGRATQSLSNSVEAASQPVAESPRLYITDSVNHRVQVVDLTGKPLYDWGLHALRPREGAGRLHYPSRAAVAPSGDFAVVCEPIEDRVQIFERRENAVDPASLLIPPSDNVSSHFGYQLDMVGTLMVIAEQDGGSLIAYDLRGKEPIEINRFGGLGEGNGQFSRPGDMTLDRAGERIIVNDTSRGRLSIFRFTRDPAAELKMLPEMTRFVKSAALEVRESGKAQPIFAAALTQDAQGNLFVIDEDRGDIVVFDPDMRFIRRFGSDVSPRLIRATDVAFDAEYKHLYVVDSLGRQIVAFSAAGDRINLPGAAGIPWDRPFGIALDKSGFAYVTDTGTNRIVKFHPQRGEAVAWGGKGLGAGEFMKPRGIALDEQGRVYVIDHGNHRGQIFENDGKFVNAFGSRLFVLPARRSAASQPAPQPLHPAVASAPAGEMLESNDKKFTVRFRTTPAPIPLNEPFVIDFSIREMASAPASAGPLTVAVDAAMPEHSHGMNVVPKVEKNADGSYTARGMLFHMPGRWELYFDVTRDGVTERAQLSMELE